MKEQVLEKNGERIVEVRSEAGKLLFIKTRKGYELKCPRSKQICLVTYEYMLKDCLECLNLAARDHESSALKRKEDQ